ncbi:hypothetical protein [Virgibacillus sp. YIM 98842]|uniref:hypothetical protein n=1 Tax=Virgibacillus sp. YIM 98842 TaxID=2663533 RepID=UPI0013DD3193|nr:hypothetical protein [Virgibacillus sp. YIM 98842]
MEELNDFLYELKKYAGQTHTLKDKYEKLNEAEKKKVMDAAPDNLSAPDQFFQPVFEWLEAMYESMDVREEEMKG